MKLMFLGIFLAFCAWSPALAESSVIASHSIRVEKNDATYVVNGNTYTYFQYSSPVDIVDGSYTLRAIGSAIFNAVNNRGEFGAYIDLVEYSDTASRIVATIYSYMNTNTKFSDEVFFTLTDAANNFYRWSAYGSAINLNVEFDLSIVGSAVAVPGPEAGAGLGALAMAGIAYLAMKRRRSVAA